MSDNIITDPSVIEKLALEATEGPTVTIKTVAPSNSDVSLPGGFIAGDGSVVKYAEVRELNGVDEEAISKAGSTGRALAVMVQRGLVSIGMEKPTKEDLDRLLSGDRDAILIGIRRVTFGNTVQFGFPCPHCKEGLEVEVDLTSDIPIKTLDNPIEDRKFIYESEKHGTIVVGLPTGTTQKKLIENVDKTPAEINTMLLAGCVESVNGIVSMGASTVLKLGMKDRENIIAEILDRNPGPRLGEVKTTCEACGEDIPMPLSLADLFRL
jgi:hypothetical protein